MMYSMHALALSILLVFLTGCDSPVGGPCDYEQHAGIAEVIGIEGDKYQLRFTLSTKPGVESHASFPLSRLNGDVFDVRTSYSEVADAVVGSRFHAVVSVITEGSCSPTSYKIGAPMKRGNR
jgi:hypothetical protein